MEHYRELIELRKKYGMRFISEDGIPSSINYPASQVYSVFKDDFDDRDNRWMIYENDVIVNRRSGFIPFAMSIKNFVFLIPGDSEIIHLLNELYEIDKYDPITCLIPVTNLSKKNQELVMKTMEKLKDIKKSLEIFAVGKIDTFNFAYCRYNKIDKNIAKVFIENNCHVLFTYDVNNKRRCLFFDPMLFSEEKLTAISEKISKRLNVKTNVNYDYNNYCITFVSSVDSISMFNLLNESEKLHIDINKNKKNPTVKTEAINTTSVADVNEVRKPKINKTFFVVEDNENTENNLPLVSTNKRIHKFKKK